MHHRASSLHLLVPPTIRNAALTVISQSAGAQMTSGFSVKLQAQQEASGGRRWVTESDVTLLASVSRHGRQEAPPAEWEEAVQRDRETWQRLNGKVGFLHQSEVERRRRRRTEEEHGRPDAAKVAALNDSFQFLMRNRERDGGTFFIYSYCSPSNPKYWRGAKTPGLK